MPDPTPMRSLSDRSAAALDALVESGFAPEQHGAPAHILTLLGVLDPPQRAAGADRSLVDVTMARVLRAGGRREASDAPPRHAGALLRADADALDALIQNEWDAASLPPRHARRGRRAVRLLASLEPAPVAVSPDLVDRTMARVRVAAEAESRFLADAPVIGAGGRFRLPDLVAVAALLFLAATLFFPAMGGPSGEAIRASCQSSMSNAGVGFALFAADHQGRLPAAPGSISAALPGSSTWWEVGAPEHSHSANLFFLASSGYVELRDLACEGNRRAPVLLDVREHADWRSLEEVSYSYQLFASGDRRRPLHRRSVLMADKSPIVLRSAAMERVDPESRSLNHGGRGQNVLFADRSVEWLGRPVTGRGDNIWLPQSLTGLGPVLLRGNETPAHHGDAFVGP